MSGEVTISLDRYHDMLNSIENSKKIDKILEGKRAYGLYAFNGSSFVVVMNESDLSDEIQGKIENYESIIRDLKGDKPSKTNYFSVGSLRKFCFWFFLSLFVVLSILNVFLVLSI